ncbi:MAG: LytTR family DNA-binding domain-containing protein [Bacteroidales bacterium]|nr:LytTR family DNA-binding domain-containing protein [Bacteroidales bacterium]
MNSIIIEDEKLAALNLERMINKVQPNICIVNKLGTVRDSVNWLKNNKVDVIFMDIRLSDGLSFAIFDEVEVKTPVIFTTAFDQYAIKVFEQNCIDYLLKPIKEVDLVRAINKLDTVRDYWNQIDIREILGTNNSNKNKYKERYLIRIGSKMLAVDCNDIYYFHSIDGETSLVTHNNKTYPMEESLDKLEHQLNPEKFFRISRKFIISYEAIEEMAVMSNRSIKIKLKIETGEDCLVSLGRLAKFKEWLDR